MCNINVLLTKPNIKATRKKRLLSNFNTACVISYDANNHGCGIWFSNNNRLYKNANYIDVYTHRREFMNSDTVIAHQRIATSGYSQKNLQPFKDERFVFVHNGVLHNQAFYSDLNLSDSNIFFTKFLEEFKLHKQKAEKIPDILEKLLSGEYGSYSMLLYDKLDKIGYYFKNSSTSIGFYKSDDYLYITTKKSNQAYFDDKLTEILISPNKLYTINLDDFEIYEVRSLLTYAPTKSYKKNHKTKYNYSNVDYDGYYGIEPYEEYDDGYEDIAIKKAQELEDEGTKALQTLFNTTYNNTKNQLDTNFKVGDKVIYKVNDTYIANGTIQDIGEKLAHICYVGYEGGLKYSYVPFYKLRKK